MVFEYGYGTDLYGGGFFADVNGGGTGIGSVGLSTTNGAGFEPYTGLALDRFNHAAGITDGVVNDAWERIIVDYDIGTSIGGEKVVASNGGNPGWDVVTTTTTGTFGSGDLLDTPSTFHSGARWGGTEPYFYKGQIAGLTLESVPEPSTIVLLITGMVGLLAYPWRKRK
jgi:hypothetical protein